MKRVSCRRLPHSAGPEPTYTMRYVASELGNQRMAQTGLRVLVEGFSLDKVVF
jgi:hypothetical protein